MHLRLLAILIFSLAGLPGVGVGPALGSGNEMTHGDGECCRIEIVQTCCGEQVERSHCLMSGGECTCAVAPVDDRTPVPAPAPRSDRETLTTILSAPPAGVRLTGNETDPPQAAGVSLCFLCAFSRSDAQAFLGVWRT